MRVLICYDPSADAQAVKDRAGTLKPGNEATVLVSWETILETMTSINSPRRDLGTVGFSGDDRGASAATMEAAFDAPAESPPRASAAGLNAQPQIVNRRRDAIAVEILGAAGDGEADLIVLGIPPLLAQSAPNPPSTLTPSPAWDKPRSTVADLS
jgi:hypothetical protein